MKNEIIKLLNKIEICKEINENANNFIKSNEYSGFTKVQLRLIAELSAIESIAVVRAIKEKIIAYENELLECKEICKDSFRFIEDKEANE